MAHVFSRVTGEKTLGDVFDDYSDPDAEPLTQLPPLHLMYFNLGIKMPGEIIDEEPTARSEDEGEDLPKNEGDDPDVIFWIDTIIIYVCVYMLMYAFICLSIYDMYVYIYTWEQRGGLA